MYFIKCLLFYRLGILVSLNSPLYSMTGFGGQRFLKLKIVDSYVQDVKCYFSITQFQSRKLYFKETRGNYRKKTSTKKNLLEDLWFTIRLLIYMSFEPHIMNYISSVNLKKTMQIYLSYETKTFKLSLTNTYDLFSTVKRKLFHIYSVFIRFDISFILFIV